MPAPARFEIVSDAPPKGRKWLTQASTQYDEGEADRFRPPSGDLQAMATNNKLVGLAGETKSSTSTATTAILINIVRGTDELLASVTVGTMASAEIGDQADFVNEDSLTLTEVNNDVTIIAWSGTTGEAQVVPLQGSTTGTIYV